MDDLSVYFKGVADDPDTTCKCGHAQWQHFALFEGVWGHCTVREGAFSHKYADECFKFVPRSQRGKVSA